MKIKNTYKYHIVFAIVIVIMNLLREYILGEREKFLGSFDLYGIVFRISFYVTFFSIYCINIKFLCPKTLIKKNLLLFILGQVSLFFAFPILRFFLEEIVIYNITGFHNYYENTRTFWFYIFDNSYYSLQVILFSTFVYLLLMFLKNSNRIHELQLERQKAELGALKMQLEPHFLFNTLNVFYTELIESQPDTAKGIHKLSELLRYLTYEGQKEYVSLQKEIIFIEDYIFFYKKRFEDNLYLEFNIVGKIELQQVPSLILIHFIENIFKHGIINDKINPVQITIQIDTNTLILSTENKISEVKNYSSNGIGRNNLQKRLKLIYKEDYTFNYKEVDAVYNTYLKIPLQ